MMPPTHRQEALSRAYVQAVAAQAGVAVTFHAADYGIDLTLRRVVREAGAYTESGHGIEVQLKSTTRAIVDDTSVSYDLEVDTYNHLRATTPTFLRILVLLVLPDDEREWTSHSELALELRRCCYWTWLYGAPPTTNARTIRIRIPREQVFSSGGLTAMMERVVTEGRP